MAKPTPPDKIYICDLNLTGAPAPLWEILTRETQPAQFDDGHEPLNSVLYVRVGYAEENSNAAWRLLLIAVWSLIFFMAGFLIGRIVT